jgi:hypothetical protein
VQKTEGNVYEIVERNVAEVEKTLGQLGNCKVAFLIDKNTFEDKDVGKILSKRRKALDFGTQKDSKFRYYVSHPRLKETSRYSI